MIPAPITLSPQAWPEYQFLDSGDGEKLERFGSYTIARPDPRILWQKHAPEKWAAADARFIRTDDDHGEWNVVKPPPSDWQLSYKHLHFLLKPATFKHVGVFPEQAPNWDWIADTIDKRPLNILNLFAYTGGATMAAAAAGATVTHVDSSKPSMDWANENARASGLSDAKIRWILEDAYKFVLREGRRGNKYDGIIMDPPRFGRGDKGEVWKIETDLPKLLTACRDILSPTASFMLINAYTVDLSSVVLARLLADLTMEKGTLTHGELTLTEVSTNSPVPNGIFARWVSR
jgi:23S rRNA (cytosine1962-C5)-methyltransferase